MDGFFHIFLLVSLRLFYLAKGLVTITKDFFSLLFGLVMGKSGKSEFLSQIVKVFLVLKGGAETARFTANSYFPELAQKKLLKRICSDASNTLYGKDKGLTRLGSYTDFCAKISKQTYGDLEPYIELVTKGNADVLFPGHPICFNTTSGTTAKPKFIPLSRRGLNACQVAGQMFMYSIINEQRGAVDGKLLVLGSLAIEGETEGGVPFGSASGRAAQSDSAIIRNKYVIDHRILGIKDYSAKYYAIALLAMQTDNISFLGTANPSSLLVLAEQINKHKVQLLSDLRNGTVTDKISLSEGERALVQSYVQAHPDKAAQIESRVLADPDKQLRPLHFLTDLKVISCWQGGNCSSYIPKLAQWYGNVPLRDPGYLSSEASAAVPLTSNSDAGCLNVSEYFFEFIPVEDQSRKEPYLLAHELELGKQYYVIFTSNSGLFRYDINDIVEVSGFFNKVPLIKFIQKGSGVTSITGEKVYEQQLSSAVQNAASITGVTPEFFICLANVDAAQYQLYAEFGEVTNKRLLEQFVGAVDAALQTLNIEYQAKRQSLRIAPMSLHVVAENSFDAYRAWRVNSGVRESQFKMILLTHDDSHVSPLTKLFELEPSNAGSEQLNESAN